MKPINAAFIHSPQIEEYCYPPDCPFKTERAQMTRRTLVSMGLLGGDLREVAPVPADRATVERFHSPDYLDILQRASKGDMGVEGLAAGLGTPETPVFFGLYDYALLAAGASLTAAKLIADGEANITFNPSGGYHHAMPARAAGFCYINDVALACMALADRFDRVAYVDIDVHHGDGVQRAFYERSDVLTVSMHQDPKTIFPFEDGQTSDCGAGPGRGYNINVPLPPGMYDAAWLGAFGAVVPPALEAFDPQVIVLEIGMDCLSGDPLAGMRLTNNAYAEAIETIRDFGVPVCATGGGGYHPDNTARGWALAWSVLTAQEQTDGAELGLGGVMLETQDWQGGLRDRVLPPPPAAERAEVDEAVERVVGDVVRNVLPLLQSRSAKHE